MWIYSNVTGYWKLDEFKNGRSGGVAKYRWEGSPEVDRLTYLGYGHITENDGNFIPIGTKVPVWAYAALDGEGDVFYFYFGVEPIRPRPIPRKEVYPLYYSFDGPSSATPKRLLTDGGTSRK